MNMFKLILPLICMVALISANAGSENPIMSRADFIKSFKSGRNSAERKEANRKMGLAANRKNKKNFLANLPMELFSNATLPNSPSEIASKAYIKQSQESICSLTVGKSKYEAATAKNGPDRVIQKINIRDGKSPDDPNGQKAFGKSWWCSTI